MQHVVLAPIALGENKVFLFLIFCFALKCTVEERLTWRYSNRSTLKLYFSTVVLNLFSLSLLNTEGRLFMTPQTGQA